MYFGGRNIEMKFYRRIFWGVLCCFFIFSFCGCYSAPYRNASATNSGTESMINPDEQSKPSAATQFEGGVLYANNNIEISIDKISGTDSFDYEVVNNGSEDITFSISGIVINGCSVYEITFPVTITAGNRMSDSYNIVGAKDYGIKQVESLAVYFEISDPGTYQTVTRSSFFIDVVPPENASFNYNVDAELFYEDDIFAAYLASNGNKYENMGVI